MSCTVPVMYASYASELAPTSQHSLLVVLFSTMLGFGTGYVYLHIYRRVRKEKEEEEAPTTASEWV